MATFIALAQAHIEIGDLLEALADEEDIYVHLSSVREQLKERIHSLLEEDAALASVELMGETAESLERKFAETVELPERTVVELKKKTILTLALGVALAAIVSENSAEKKTRLAGGTIESLEQDLATAKDLPEETFEELREKTSLIVALEGLLEEAKQR